MSSKRAEQAVFTNMCMIYDDRGNVLVQDRVDPGWPGLTFPGGHVEKGESFTRSVIREVKEETGLDIRNPKICGVKQFQTEYDERYVVVFYRTNEFSGELCDSPEGRVFWLKPEELKNYTLSNDFEYMVELSMNDDRSEFYYSGDPEDWTKELL